MIKVRFTRLRNLTLCLSSSLFFVSCPLEMHYGPAPTRSSSDPGVTTLDIRKLRSMETEPYSPKPIFRELWEEVSECSHLSGDFDRIKWFHVKGDIPCHLYPTKKCNALWIRPHNVYLSDETVKFLEIMPTPKEYSGAEYVVKHEMLHDLTQQARHTSIFRRCGELYFDY